MKVQFEDQHLLVLEKPAGLLSQGDASGAKNLVDLLRIRFGRPYVGLIHRLDRNTSGLMIVAKRTKAAERLTTQLQNGKLVRKYRALLEGRLETDSGREFSWTDWLIKNESTNLVSRARENQAGAKVAHLSGAVLGYPSFKEMEFTGVELELETGRSHQIRAQSALRGHPIAGDFKYGSEARGLSFLYHQQLALHSCYLSFDHPMPPHGQLEFVSLPCWQST